MPVFQLILTSDTINQGREKINVAFSATTGLWSGSTGFQSLIHNNGTGNIASGDYAISTGSGNTASGDVSFTQGIGNLASGDYSFAGGFNTIASADNQVVIGKWNDSGNTTNGAFIIGDGISAINRRNVLEVLESANNAVLINGLGASFNQIAFSVTNGVTTDRILRVQGNGKVGIGAGTAAHELHVNGEIGHKDAYVSFSSQVTTTDDTPTVLKTYSFKATSWLNIFKVSVLAYRNVGFGTTFTKVFYVTTRRVGGIGGVTSIDGIDVVHTTGSSAVDATAIVPISPGNSLVIQVTGEIGRTWAWTCDIEVREISISPLL